jgi:hypothetical protein
MKKVIGPIGLDLTKLLRSMTSVYQLLPRYPVVDSGTGGLTRVAETVGLPGVDAERATAALQFHHDIDTAIGSRPPNAYAIHPIVGIMQPTHQSARFRDGAVTMVQSYEGVDHAGDGTVPRVSATPVELSDQGSEIYAPDQHGSLQNAEGPLTQLVGLLSARPTTRFRSGMSGFGVRIDDIFAADEPISLVVTADDPPPSVTAVVTDAAHGRVVLDAAVDVDGDGVFRGWCPPLPAGDYRLTVSDGSADRSPAHALFIVAPADGDQPR